MRMLFSILVSLCICLGIFFGMHLMTSSNNKVLKESEKTRHLVYLREKKETQVEKKKRIKPKEPIKKQPVKKIKIIKTHIKTNVNKNVKIKPFKVQPVKNIDISAISSLSGAQIEVDTGPSFVDAKSLEALKRVNPKYPRGAKRRKQEGFVQLAFSIDTQGIVSNVTIVNSNPSGVFEKNAKRAIKRWQFKPSTEAKNATITFNFRLAR